VFTKIIVNAFLGKNFMIKKRKVAGIKKMPVGRVKYNKLRNSRMIKPFFRLNLSLVKRK
jgi:hypothetical protein